MGWTVKQRPLVRMWPAREGATVTLYCGYNYYAVISGIGIGFV